MTFFVLLISLLQSLTFPVDHDHFRGKGRGRLTISRDAIFFEEEKNPEHSKKWSFTDIQEIKIESAQEVQILTYEDARWKLNKDRTFKFKLVEGEITPEIVAFLRTVISTPVVSAVFARPEDAIYTIPAKHKHALAGGCEGNLLIGEKTVYYVTTEKDHSRVWPIVEIVSIGRMSAFDFRISVRERSLVGGEKNFQFQLKRPMEREVYDRLWQQIYEPQG